MCLSSLDRFEKLPASRKQCKFLHIRQLIYLFDNQIIQNRFSFRYFFANTYLVWILLQIQDSSEDNDNQDIAANEEDETKTIREMEMTVFSLVVSTLIVSLGLDAFFHNVSLEIFEPMFKSSFQTLTRMMALGIFWTFITIMKNNLYQENNVSFYTHINWF